MGYPRGDCQAGISAEYTSDGKDLVMGISGIKHLRGRNLNSHTFYAIWRLLCAIKIDNWSQRVMQRKATSQNKTEAAFQPAITEE